MFDFHYFYPEHLSRQGLLHLRLFSRPRRSWPFCRPVGRRSGRRGGARGDHRPAFVVGAIHAERILREEVVAPISQHPACPSAVRMVVTVQYQVTIVLELEVHPRSLGRSIRIRIPVVILGGGVQDEVAVGLHLEYARPTLRRGRGTAGTAFSPLLVAPDRIGHDKDPGHVRPGVHAELPALAKHSAMQPVVALDVSTGRQLHVGSKAIRHTEGVEVRVDCRLESRAVVAHVVHLNEIREVVRSALDLAFRVIVQVRHLLLAYDVYDALPF